MNFIHPPNSHTLKFDYPTSSHPFEKVIGVNLGLKLENLRFRKVNSRIFRRSHALAARSSSPEHVMGNSQNANTREIDSLLRNLLNRNFDILLMLHGLWMIVGTLNLLGKIVREDRGHVLDNICGRIAV